MSIVSQILSLRSNRASTVSTLLALLDWQKAAHDDGHILSRGYAVADAVDILLLSVAAPAGEAFNEPPTTGTTRRSVLMLRRQRRRSDTPQLRQGSLFAPTAA
jgi:hypothetical protein